MIEIDDDLFFDIPDLPMSSEGVTDIDHNDFHDAVEMADLALDFHCLATCISCAISDNDELGILEFFDSDATPFVRDNYPLGISAMTLHFSRMAFKFQASVLSHHLVQALAFNVA